MTPVRVNFSNPKEILKQDLLNLASFIEQLALDELKWPTAEQGLTAEIFGQRMDVMTKRPEYIFGMMNGLRLALEHPNVPTYLTHLEHNSLLLEMLQMLGNHVKLNEKAKRVSG